MVTPVLDMFSKLFGNDSHKSNSSTKTTHTKSKNGKSVTREVKNKQYQLRIEQTDGKVTAVVTSRLHKHKKPTMTMTINKKKGEKSITTKHLKSDSPEHKKMTDFVQSELKKMKHKK